MPFTIVSSAVLAAVFLLPPSGTYARPVPATVDSVVLAGITLSLQQEYDSAAAVFNRLETAGHNGAVGPFYRTMVEYIRLTDHEDFTRDSVFNAYAARTDGLLAPLMAGEPGAMDAYMAGTVAGYRGLLSIKKGRWLRGLRHGLRSMELIERAVAQDSSLADAYWSLGMYRYYGSRMAGTFSWLPFVRTDTDGALSMVRHTVENGRYAREAAALALAWLYYDDERFDDALALADTLRNRFPDNRMFMWLRGDVLFGAGRNRDALEQFGELMDALAAHEPGNTYHRALCRWKRIQLLFRTGADDAARDELNILLETPMDAHTRERFAAFREKAEKLRDTARQTGGDGR